MLATSSYCSRLAFDEGMLWESPPPVVRVSRSMGVCSATHLPSFASRVRCGCALAATSSTCRSRFAFDGCVLWQPPTPPVVHVSRPIGWVYALPPTSSHRSRLAFDAGVLWQPPPPPVVRVSRSMGVCFGSHLLHLSFASRVRLGVGSCQPPVVRVSRPIGCVVCQPPVVRVSRLMGVCSASHLHPSFASRIRLGMWCASHLHPSFASRFR